MKESILLLLDTDSLIHVLGMLTNHEDGPRDFINLACTSRSVSNLINKHWTYIKPDSTIPRNRFLDQLPILYGNISQSRTDRIKERRRMIDGETPWIQSQIVTGDYLPRIHNKEDINTRQLYVRANSCISIPMLSTNRVVTSIKIRLSRSNVKININIGGTPLFCMSGDLLPIFGDANGDIDIMPYLRHLPQTNYWWHDWIQLINTEQEGGTDRSPNDIMVTITDHPVHPDDISVARLPQWNLLFYYGNDDPITNPREMNASRSVIQFRIYSNYIDECLIFYFEQNNNNRVNIVQFELQNYNNEQCYRVTIPGWCCRCTKTLGGGELNGELYRIPINKRLDMAFVDPKLHVTFDRPVSAEQKFHIGSLSYNYAYIKSLYLSEKDQTCRMQSIQKLNRSDLPDTARGWLHTVVRI